MKAWTDEYIIHLFYFSKPKIARGVLETLISKEPSNLSQTEHRILAILGANNRSLSANELYNELKQKEKIGQVTVYNKLKNLEKQELILERL